MRIRVPASSANLGPGFDCFGIAWQCYNEIEFERNDRLEISGCDEKYCTADNLAYRAVCAALGAAGIEEERGVKIRFGRTDIPVSRGMGSSAALISGAVLAANELFGLGYDKEKLFAIATAVEGHPDNIAPAMFGGFTASTMEGERAYTAHFPLSEKLSFVLLVPNQELSTALSRSVLPGTYSRADAVFNVSRAAMLIKAMETGDAQLLQLAMQDRIHQPYRKPLIAGYDKAESIARECGAAAMCISGAGSTMLCVSDDVRFGEKMRGRIGEEFPEWNVLPVQADTQGARIL